MIKKKRGGKICNCKKDSSHKWQSIKYKYKLIGCKTQLFLIPNNLTRIIQLKIV
jgi:hypothetical protein